MSIGTRLLASLLVVTCVAEEQRQRPALSTRLTTYSIRSAAQKLGRSDWTELTQGNKVVLPARLRAQLEQRSLPITQFQICNPDNKEKRIYTGPLDFCSADGECYMPTWMMRQLKLSDGDVCAVATAQFPSGTFARFQPHSSDFLDIVNHYYLLLKTLDHFAALTAGTTIRVTDGSKVHFLDVLEVKGKSGAADASRGKAIDLTMVELEVDIRPPKDQEKADKAAAKAAAAAAKQGGKGAAVADAADGTADAGAAAADTGAVATKPAPSRGAARARGQAAADAAPVAKFKAAKPKGAKPAVGKKLGGAGPDGAGEEGGAELAESEPEQPIVVRVAQQLVALLLAFARRLLRLLFAPSGIGTAATQVG